jgi:hypothetical protein
MAMAIGLCELESAPARVLTAALLAEPAPGPAAQ